MKITFADEFKGNPEEVAKKRRKFAGYPPAVHSMSPETQHEILEGNELRKLQEVDLVCQEVIKWVLDGKAPKLSEVRGKVQEVLTVRQLFNTVLFMLNNGVLSRDVIRRLCNKGRDQDSKGIWGLGIDRMVTYSTSDNYVLRHLSVSSVHRSGGKQSVYSFFSTISMKQCW